MTTYDMKSASQRALTTLVKSLPFTGGLPSSLIVDLDTPEERLAARLVQRRGLEPPIDVEAIAASLATVTTKRFPVEIDGLCLDLKVRGKTPKIWIAEGLHRVRRRFTLAHEIGHIRIPWHTGTIVDEIDLPNSREKDRYREMEAEANRFAAELLMPTSWVLRTIERTRHPTDLMNIILEVADVSYPAALFRVHKIAPAGFVGVIVEDDVIVWSGKTRGTQAQSLGLGSNLSSLDETILEKGRELTSRNLRYIWWKVRDGISIPPTPVEPWREILDRILLSIPEDVRIITKSRVNAVIGSAFGKVSKGSSVEQLYHSALQSCTNRNDRDEYLPVVFRHPEFSEYLIARCHAQASKR